MPWQIRQHGFRVLLFDDGRSGPYPKVTVFPVATIEPIRWAAIVHESSRRAHWLSENFDSPEAAPEAALRHARGILAPEWHHRIDSSIEELPAPSTSGASG